MNTCQEYHDKARCLQMYKQILENLHSLEVRGRHHDWLFPDEQEHLSLQLSCQPEILNKEIVKWQLEISPIFIDYAYNPSRRGCANLLW